MNIEYKNYVIAQSQSDRFHLQKKVLRKKKDDETEYEVLDDMAYDVKLDSAINFIIHEELSEKKETVTLKEFLNEFKREKEELMKVLN